MIRCEVPAKLYETHKMVIILFGTTLRAVRWNRGDIR